MVVIEGGRERMRVICYGCDWGREGKREREGVICYGCDVIAMVVP